MAALRFDDPAGAPGDALACLRDGPVAHLVLNQPQRRNAMSAGMWERLALLARELGADNSVRLVIVRGAGEAAFCAGADITEFEQVYADPARSDAYNANVREAQIALETLSTPVLAMVHGACVGGGCGIALSCDLRFAADDARFGITAARLGVGYSVPDTRRLAALVGPSRAKEILFSGRLLGSAEALAIGLVDRVVPKASLADTVAAFAALLLENSRESMRVAKAMVNSLTGLHPRAETELDAMFVRSFLSDDFREGYSAFREKRSPRFP